MMSFKRKNIYHCLDQIFDFLLIDDYDDFKNYRKKEVFCEK